MKMVHSAHGRPRPSGLLLVLALLAGAAAGAENDNLVIADFEGAKIETLAGLALPVIADELVGGTSTATLTLIHPGAQASRGALRISFKVDEGYAKPFSAVWPQLGAQGLATDLSAYKGLRFHARSPGGSFVAGIGRATGTRYMIPFEVKPEWSLVELPFGKFEKATPVGAPPLPFTPKDVHMIGISVASHLRGPFDLDLDQVEFYK